MCLHGFSTRVQQPLSSFPPFLCSNYNYLLNSCSSFRDFKRLHAQIITNGLSTNLILATRLIGRLSALAPTMDYARKLFDGIPQRDVFTWNTLIRGYTDLGPCEEALLLYKYMHSSGLSPDHFTFPFVVRSCAVLLALREGMEVHCNIIKNGFGFNVFVQSSLVSMYAQNGVTLSSEMVFEEMMVKNIVSWTAMIAGYAQNGFYKKSLDVFQSMVVSGTQPNVVTLVSILPACAGLEFLNLGQLIHGYGVKLGLDADLPLMNSLIAFYGKCGKVEIARFLFDGMRFKNLVSWNALIASYEQNDMGSEAIKLFVKMQDEMVEFDYITMVSVISACVGSGALDTGIWVHGLMKSKGLENNASVANALLDMYAKCGSIDLARDIFDKLPQRCVVSWSAMIGAYAAHGHGEDALRLFAKMKAEGVKPNSFTFISILTACRHLGLVEEGKKFFDSMTKDYSIMPGVEHCSCVVDLLGRAGRLNDAFEFIEKMPVEPDAGVWGALLGACRIHGNLELAELVAENLLRLDPHTVTYYVLMSNIYKEAGRWDDALRLRKLMEEEDLKKIPGCSFLQINRRFHTFHSGPRFYLS